MYEIIKPLLYCLDPETAHNMAIRALKLGLVKTGLQQQDPILASRLWQIDFPNPIGLAAGFDKHGEVIDAMLSLGFGFVEAGTVTPLPQPGNAKPRLFRLDEDGAAINRFGFNSQGLDAFTKRLQHRRETGRTGIVGANVGKNKDSTDSAADFAKGIKSVCGVSDYLVVNISSPNTPGLRDLQARENLSELIKRVQDARADATSPQIKIPPLLIKVAPDLDDNEKQDIAEVVLDLAIDGLIIGNTTIARPSTLRNPHRTQTGGLSGRPLMAPSTAVLSDFYRLTGGKMPLVGCGGVASGADAYQKIRAGASLVQLYTAFIFQGPGIVWQIKSDLAKCLKADGFTSIKDAIGADHRK